MIISDQFQQPDGIATSDYGCGGYFKIPGDSLSSDSLSVNAAEHAETNGDAPAAGEVSGESSPEGAQ